ncbi:DNA breaking-rejoining protein [Salmonella enterica subsp. enterica serovar Abaetetuba]|uniref:RecE family exodeoxyribonuclease n=2 Tax=Salmonella enterica TaxID=28901 RepID=UPI0008FC9443|nr:RecE family exodeoxyribonuclease [Salmonella enterica]EAP4124017.1 DNA breaking-rejoining protein [Salmonella enterica subsp. enterica serovar Infantis]EAR0341225.1 DNA breaking-rejoining protein [Salmonella enterica subsp. enterica serovar Anatum]EBV5807024.1 DNA breaking-rejoining protein [Salmonella enterica subsp. enterica serovar Abaetetuba]EBV7996122.1 DNA breaking-rejoining protein [Salmonella enterica subsp. enterica serovar Pomona]ECO0980940.1 DNA breaking-rejoining protein [Salmon
MSENKEDFALHCLVKNEEARKRLGIKAGFFWTTAKKLSVAVSRCIAAMDDKGYDEDDFKKPVRVNLPVVNDLPPEGVFDTEFCNRYEKGGEDGKTMILIPGAASGGTDTEKDSNNDECQDCEVSVATLPLPQRFLHIFTYAAADKKYLHHATRAQRRHITVLEMEQENSYIQNLLMGIRDIARLEKQDNADMLRLTDAIKTVFSVTKNHQPREFKNFISAWLDTEHIDRGLLVKEWVKGNRVSHITRTASGANAGGGNLTDRGESFVHDQASLERDVAMGVLARAMDVDIYNPHPAHEKRIDEIIAENKPPFSVFRDKFISMPGGRDYSRAIVVASVKEAPIGIEVIPAHVTEYLNKVLTETDHTNPDPLIVDIACGRTSQPMPVKGSANDDEEEPQSAGALADEPATPEAVEQDTTEHHPDPQPLENEPPVSQTEAGYQKIRAELHEARKNIPPKNPVDVGKQLAAARGEYVEGISDPNDPKWVHNDYSASNEGEKTEVATDNSVSAADTADYVDHSEDFSNQHEPETCHSEPAADQNEPEMPQTEPEPQYTWPEYFEPGRYEGMPNDIYHAANGISSTMVKDARVSLMYYEGRHVSKTIKKERSKVLDMGNLVHVLALQPEILDAEFSIEPEIPEGALTTTATIRAVIDEYNASLTPQLSADEIKTLLEEYNSSLPAPVPLGGDKDAIGIAYLELPDDFKRIIGDDKNFTVSTMKACIKEYNATLPPQVKTSGNRDALLEQLAIINPDLVAQEAQKPQPLKVSGAKADLIQAVKSVKPDAVFADELLDAWRENPGNKILVTRQQYETALAIQSALYAHPEAGKLLQNPTRAVEVSYFGIDDDTGLDIRVRPDVELEYEGLRIGFDLKTISMWDVKEDSLKSRLHREITMRDYHLSAGMYCNVADLDKFAWIFVNKDEGYHWVAVVWASDSLLELGKLEYRRTIRAIANAMDTGEWPAPVTADYTDELNDYDLRRLEALREMA